MTNLMLSWQQATLLALGCGVAGVTLVYAGHSVRGWRWGARVGPFLRETGVVVATGNHFWADAIVAVVIDAAVVAAQSLLARRLRPVLVARQAAGPAPTAASPSSRR
jgi:hypothetical protein